MKNKGGWRRPQTTPRIRPDARHPQLIRNAGHAQPRQPSSVTQRPAQLQDEHQVGQCQRRVPDI
jgi:hypothetical protein